VGTGISTSKPATLPTRVFGKTGEKIPILGLGTAPGGFGLNDFDAVDVIHAAIDNGVTYLDTAPGYERAQIQLGEVLPARRDEVFLVTKTFTGNGARAVEILEQSLRDLKTDCVDVTFVHSVGSLDPDEVLSKDGALAGLRSAQKRGLTRYVGFTAHNCPSKSEKLLKEVDFDAVMFALNWGQAYLRLSGRSSRACRGEERGSRSKESLWGRAGAKV
jgi:predicted aldo/keto reductase-like oxidoreductase